MAKSVKNQSFKIDSCKNILVLGNSIGETSLNPAILSNYANYCQSSENYMLSYLKLKYILRDNQHIDTCLLIYSLDADADELLYSDKKVKYFYPLMGKEELSFYAGTRYLLTNLSIMQYIKSYCGNTQYIYQLGGYMYLERNKLQQDIEIRMTTSESKKVKYGNKLQIKYLDKISALCSAHNIELILFQPPVYNSEKYIDKQKEESLRNKFARGIKFIDYSNFALPDSCFGDITHLNHKGARALSSHIKEFGL